jgi:hypothetical protein
VDLVILNPLATAAVPVLEIGFLSHLISGVFFRYLRGYIYGHRDRARIEKACKEILIAIRGLGIKGRAGVNERLGLTC